MARRTGTGDIPLDPESLAELQQEILGSKTVIRSMVSVNHQFCVTYSGQ